MVTSEDVVTMYDITVGDWLELTFNNKSHFFNLTGVQKKAIRTKKQLDGGVNTGNLCGKKQQQRNIFREEKKSMIKQRDQNLY